MFEYVFQRTMSGILFGLTNLISSIPFTKACVHHKTEIDDKLEPKITKSDILSSEHKMICSIIPELPGPRWIKIGKVTNLYMYPLVSGKAYNTDECEITFDETYMYKKGRLLTWDRSFIVYDKNTKCIMTIKNFPQLLKVELSVKNNHLTLQADNMPTLSVQLRNKSFVKCSYSSSEEYKIFPIFTCADCGDEVAEWLSSFFDNEVTNLRMGYSMNFVNPLKMYWQSWNGHKSLFIGNTWNGHSLGPFISITPNNVPSTNQISQEAKLRKKAEMLEIHDSYGMIYPIINISVSNQYLERKWEWIKIGDVTIKVSKPAIIKGSNRAFDENMLFFGLGVNCKLYNAGYIQTNDTVYVHFP